MLIVDSFLFFDEFDLLAARVRYLSSVVDYFVAVESTYSFSGNQKKPRLADYIAKYLPEYSSRIYIAVNKSYISSSTLVNDEVIDTLQLPLPTSRIEVKRVATSTISDIDAWINDTYQREFISIPLLQIGLSPDDLVILSDIDEIPSLHFINLAKNGFAKYFFHYAIMEQYVYCPKYKIVDEWIGSVAFKYKLLNEYSLNEARFLPKRDPSLNSRFEFTRDGGWHFTSFGSIAKIQLKIKSWGHRELDNLLNSLFLRYRLKRGFDVLGRRIVIKSSSDYQSLPDTILSSFTDYYKGPFINPSVADTILNFLLSYANSIYVKLRSVIRGICQ